MPNLPLLKIWREMRRSGQIYVSHGKRLNLRRIWIFIRKKAAKNMRNAVNFVLNSWAKRLNAALKINVILLISFCVLIFVFYYYTPNFLQLNF